MLSVSNMKSRFLLASHREGMVVHVRVGNLLRHGYGVCQLHVSGVVASDGYGVDGPQTVVVIYVAGLFIGLVRSKLMKIRLKVSVSGL